MTEEDVQHYKIIFLGDQYVGKSSILNRFYQDRFEPDYQATIGLDFHSKNVEIKGTTIRLLLYDTAGQEKFKSLIPMYIRDANIIIVVYDISNKDSFIHTDHWVNETKDLKREDAIFVLVGNKIDLEDKRAVSKNEAQNFANSKGFLFGEVSTKTGNGMEELFNSIIFPEMAKKFKIGVEEDVKIEKEDNKDDNNDIEDTKIISLEENLINENQKLKDELKIYKEENEKLKIENDNLKKQNNLLNNNINELNIELNKKEKIISNFNNIQKNDQGNINIINNLNEFIKAKDKEINDLKLKLQNNPVNKNKLFTFDDILFVHFISMDQKINCGIKCLKTDTFAEVEEKLYQKYEEYRETNNNFLHKGKIVLRFKKICENNIIDGDKIELIKLE